MQGPCISGQDSTGQTSTGGASPLYIQAFLTLLVGTDIISVRVIVNYKPNSIVGRYE